MTPKELTKLIKLCRKHGITRYKQGTFEIEIGPLPPRAKIMAIGPFAEAISRSNKPQGFRPVTKEELAKHKKSVEDERPPSDDEMLMWSTESFDEIRNQRKEAIK